MVFIILIICAAVKIISEAAVTGASIPAAAAEIIADSVALIMS